MTRRATSALLIQKIETNLTTNQKALVLFNTLPSLIVGGSITKFSIFFRPLQFISTPPPNLLKFWKIPPLPFLPASPN